MRALRYGSVCSGIESASVAWHSLGFTPSWFSEIAPFPSRVLAERWPDVPNFGDFTRITDEQAPPPGSVDVLVGGTPCQSFSVAGGRAGLDDPRGHLAVEFLRFARRLRARWLVWENVPGVFSVDDGDAFATFIGLAIECGYGVAWRVLDAQYLGVPQRRRRVFVVGYLGDWRPSCAVLLERPSMQRDSAPRRGARPQTASGAGGGTHSMGRVTNVVETLRACAGKSTSSVGPLLAYHHRNAPDDVLVADTLRASGAGRAPDHGMIAIPIQDATRRVRSQHGMGVGEPGDPMYTGMTRGEHAVLAFHATQDPIVGCELAPAIGCEPGSIGVLSFDEQQITHPENRARPRVGDPAPTLARESRVDIVGSARPRRLTPREWERLQGFPDDYTLVDDADDSPRYEALGNSMAVPVMRWIGRRLQMVDAIVDEEHR